MPPKRQPTVANLTNDLLWKKIRDEVTVICNKMKASPNTEVAKLKERLSMIDVQHIDDIYRASFPALSCQMDQAAVGLPLQTLDFDVHHHKWALTIQGPKGEEKDEKVTRSLCVDLAKQHLGVCDAAGSDLAACHRLSRSAGSGIILRIWDL